MKSIVQAFTALLPASPAGLLSADALRNLNLLFVTARR